MCLGIRATGCFNAASTASKLASAPGGVAGVANVLGLDNEGPQERSLAAELAASVDTVPAGVRVFVFWLERVTPLWRLLQGWWSPLTALCVRDGFFALLFHVTESIILCLSMFTGSCE